MFIYLATRWIVGQFRNHGGLRNSLSKVTSVYNTDGISGIRNLVHKITEKIFILSEKVQLQQTCPSKSVQCDCQPYYDNYKNQPISSQVHTGLPKKD